MALTDLPCLLYRRKVTMSRVRGHIISLHNPPAAATTTPSE